MARSERVLRPPKMAKALARVDAPVFLYIHAEFPVFLRMGVLCQSSCHSNSACMHRHPKDPLSDRVGSPSTARVALYGPDIYFRGGETMPVQEMNHPDGQGVVRKCFFRLNTPQASRWDSPLTARVVIRASITFHATTMKPFRCEPRIEWFRWLTVEERPGFSAGGRAGGENSGVEGKLSVLRLAGKVTSQPTMHGEKFPKENPKSGTKSKEGRVQGH